MTLFSKIVKGEIPCYKIAETNDYLAFLDICPVQPGHVLVIPKAETDYIFELDDETYIGLHLFAKVLAGALKQAFACNRIGVVVAGLEVPHAHIHLIPMNAIEDLDISKTRKDATKEELEISANKIRSFI